MSKISLRPLEDALSSLKEGYEEKPSEIVRDGIIQRFEYTIEQCWKSAKKVLADQNVDSDTPRNVFRELANLGWIESAEPWLRYLQPRNLTSHLYKSEVAEQVFSVIKDFISDAETLLKVLKTKQ